MKKISELSSSFDLYLFLLSECSAKNLLVPLGTILLLSLHLLVIECIVHETIYVKEGFDAVDVRADHLEVLVSLEAGSGTDVSEEELSEHLLAADTGPEAPRGGRGGGLDLRDEQDGGEEGQQQAGNRHHLHS